MIGGALRIAVVVAGAVASLASAGPSIKRPTTRDMEVLFNRASFDMNCNTLTVTWLDAETRGVAGCSKRITYVMVCPPLAGMEYRPSDPDPEPCKWVANFSSDGPPERRRGP